MICGFVMIDSRMNLPNVDVPEPASGSERQVVCDAVDFPKSVNPVGEPAWGKPRALSLLPVAPAA
jgi:hypothetical protein